MNERCARRDLVANSRTLTLFWVLPATTILTTGYLADVEWVITISWTLSLLVMSVACLANARGCGRIHCYFTGPYFLLLALVSFAHGIQLLPLGRNGWRIIGSALLIGSVLLCVVPELLRGRYRRAPRNSDPGS